MFMCTKKYFVRFKKINMIAYRTLSEFRINPYKKIRFKEAFFNEEILNIALSLRFLFELKIYSD